MSESPLPNGPNGAGGCERQASGRFAPGNAGGPGNPYARQVPTLRSALLNAVTPADMTAIVSKLVSDAKAGSVAGSREEEARPMNARILAMSD